MTREQALKELDECIENDDVEVAHSDADLVLCKLLVELGYADVVDKYALVSKWYA